MALPDTVDLPATLAECRIPDLPPSFYYIPNFITPSEEAALLSKINTTPRWTNLTKRRLQVYPTALTPTNTLLPTTPLPPWLTNPILPRLSQLSVFASTPHAAPNHCLVNEYKPGQGIMPHEDGAAYAPVVATVSLGAPIVLDIYEKNGEGKVGAEPRWRLLQEERSLLVTAGAAYEGLVHGIREAAWEGGLAPGAEGEGVANWDLLGESERFREGVERGLRVSLTWRDVLRVSKLGAALFGRR